MRPKAIPWSQGARDRAGITTGPAKGNCIGDRVLKLEEILNLTSLPSIPSTLVTCALEGPAYDTSFAAAFDAYAAEQPGWHASQALSTTVATIFLCGESNSEVWLPVHWLPPLKPRVSCFQQRCQRIANLQLHCGCSAISWVQEGRRRFRSPDRQLQVLYLHLHCCGCIYPRHRRMEFSSPIALL
jgi:hypothetical protein